ncbi:MAG: hypothetical protein AAF998_11705 [Bacteroidota bacterium]
MPLFHLFIALSGYFTLRFTMPVPDIDSPLNFQEGVLTYATTIQPVVPKADWKDLYSVEITRRFVQYNLPETTTVILGKEAVRIDEVDTDMGWKGKSSRIISRRGGAEIRCKQLQFVCVCAEQGAGPEVFSEEEPPVPRIELTSEYEEILGYRCRRARYELYGERSDVWFTEEVVVPRVAGTLHREGIPGTIFRVKEYPGAGQAFARETVLVALTPETPQEQDFRPPPNCSVLPNWKEAQKTNQEALEVAFSSRESAPAGWEGVWKLQSATDQVFLEISLLGTEVRLKTCFLPSGREIEEIGRKSGDWILVEKGDRYRILQMDGTDYVVEPTFAPFSWERSTQEDLEQARSARD